MYGDTESMRRRVSQLREQSTDVRSLADELVARTDALRWTGRAATAMRHRVADRAAQLRRAADGHDRAADALAHHLQVVAETQDRIAEIEQRATTLVEDARTRVARIAATNAAGAIDATDAGSVQREPQPEDALLVAFDPPPSGHRDWLTVELPGL
jgi:uncharacterized protein YukE